MKKTGKYFANPPKKKHRLKKRRVTKRARKKNPVPFAAVVANPPKKKAGMWVAKKPRRNPLKRRKARRKNPVAAPLSVRSSTARRKVGKRGWHHKRGTFVYNPVAKKKRRRRSNPLAKIHMKMKRRRGKSRRRNPISRRGGFRRSGRRSSSRRRNPIPSVSELFPMNTLATAGAAVVGGVVINTVVNKFAVPTASRTWKLPGIDATMLASQDPATRATFWTKNAWVLALWKGGLGAIVGWAIRNQAPRLSYGFTLGSMVVAGNDVLRATKITTADGTLQAGSGGVSRMFLGNGVGYVPGVNTRLTGPAQDFLTMNNVPRPRGMGARVGPGTMSAMTSAVEPANRGAN